MIQISVPRHGSAKCGGFSLQKHFDDWAGKAPRDKWPHWASAFACLISGGRTGGLWTPGKSKINSRAQAGPDSLADLWKKRPALLWCTVWARALKILIPSEEEHCAASPKGEPEQCTMWHDSFQRFFYQVKRKSGKAQNRAQLNMF